MDRCLLGLIAVCFCSQPAMAYLTATADKPDPYARRHYTAADLPAAKKLASMKKGKKQKQTISDEEIAAEIAREDAGRSPATPNATRAPKEKDCAKSPRTSELRARHFATPAATHSIIAVCRLKPMPSKIASRYLISDSDGYDACNDRGGDVIAGNDDDRALANVKDAGQSERAKK